MEIKSLLKYFLLVFFCSFGMFIQSQNVKNQIYFKSLKIDTLLHDNISIRAILVDKNKIWYAANNSRFGFFDLETKLRTENKIVSESSELEFRSMAQNGQNIFLLSIVNPAFLYKVSKTTLKPTLVYQENHEKVFYDSFQFWNDKEGIAIGDPTDGFLSIIITRDGGLSWNKIQADKLPPLVDGEAAFAASNTNIVVKGNHTWVVSGGIKSRVFYSADKGKTWSVFATPIVQGKQMTGIFSADFYDAKKGFISGGDYEIPTQNFGNKAMTTDGGKTWNLVAEHAGFGFSSCIQYVPKSKGKGLVSVGATGIYYSNDAGVSWKQLAKDPSLYTIRFIDANTAVAAGRNKLVRIEFLK
ncbi:sialidase family protein [Flavobacterium flavipallidum]|uniref:Oxidoreductase n=1 Tax=Flavobacterium flavipallidum TaxID=3139140 RepID=A0ABU9HQ41_9FLAO